MEDLDLRLICTGRLTLSLCAAGLFMKKSGVIKKNVECFSFAHQTTVIEHLTQIAKVKRGLFSRNVPLKDCCTGSVPHAQ